jgi:phosphoribosylamine--glycine ligase
MNILLIGSGGREHAMAWKIKQSKLTDRLYIAPGNAGTSLVGENIAIKADDFPGLLETCLDRQIDLVIVGPELPLVNGIRDFFEGDPRAKHILMVGPGRKGAALEGSKDYSKRFMNRHGVPTAKARTFSSAELSDGLKYLETCTRPIVLKADGLAAGKGVIISDNLEESKRTLTDMLANKMFGDASANVLVEEFLEGVELSVFVLTDGTNYVLLPEAKDYKRIGENDSGPNTGGMGAVSPVPFADAAFMRKVEDAIIRPTIEGLIKDKVPYRGFIFFGLINVKGTPYVIEYNARMGDPETEAVMTRIQSDFVELLAACARGELKDKRLTIDSDSAVTVMLVAGGYPGDYQKGKPIEGITQPSDALLFHAGTRHSGGRVVTDGGRVLAVTGRGKTLDDAKKSAYQSISGISWQDMYFRRDIGLDLLQK